MRLIFAMLMACFVIPSGQSEEPLRTWTSASGSTAQGRLLNQDGTSVVLVLKNGRKLTLKRDQLSESDLTYLQNRLAAEPSGGAATPEVGSPEKSVRVDTKEFVKREGRLSPGAEDRSFEVLETEHFLLLYNSGSRPRGIGEHAEKMWHGMARQHPTFSSVWGDRRMALVLVGDRISYEGVLGWHADQLTEQDHSDFEEKANEVKLTAARTVAASFVLRPAFWKEQNLLPAATILDIERAESDGPWPAFLTHVLASDLLMQFAGGDPLALDEGSGFFFLSTGVGYLKEIRLCREIETVLVSAESSAGGGGTFFEGESFSNGSSWAGILRSAIRRELTSPSLASLHSLEQPALNQEQAALCYALVAFMQSTPQRLEAFGQVFEEIRRDQRAPDPARIAELFGYRSMDEFDAAWKAFIEDRSAFR